MTLTCKLIDTCFKGTVKIKINRLKDTEYMTKKRGCPMVWIQWSRLPLSSFSCFHNSVRNINDCEQNATTEFWSTHYEGIWLL